MKLLRLLGPGILVAATGVGAGDLATASFAGSQLGTAILWAAVLGAFLKFVLNEGLARWQLATGDTLLEGAVLRFGRVVGWLFLPYLFLWSFFVGAALMSACGAALQALFPLFGDADRGRMVYGALSSLLGLVLVRAGGFRLFERVMTACIGVMLATVVVMAVMLWPGTAEVLRGLLLPGIPDLRGEGVVWTVALMGGVGGTLTVLCYGYWIREEGRAGIADRHDGRAARGPEGCAAGPDPAGPAGHARGDRPCGGLPGQPAGRLHHRHRAACQRRHVHELKNHRRSWARPARRQRKEGTRAAGRIPGCI